MNTDREVIHALGRIEGRLDGIEAGIEQSHDAITGVDERLRNVEKRVAINSGVVSTAVAAGVSGLVTMLGGPSGAS